MSEMNQDNITALDAALSAAKQRVAEKDGETNETKTSRPRLTPEEKAQRAQAKTEEKARKAVEREAKREAKRLEREAVRTTPHMKKVEKAAKALPDMASETVSLFEMVQGQLAASEITKLVAHLQHFVRVESTKAALEQRLEAGQVVAIVGGDPRYIGKTGTITKAQRIRCYVSVPGVKKDVYLFTADVRPIESAFDMSEDESATGTHG